jgi:hypothetical protein
MMKLGSFQNGCISGLLCCGIGLIDNMYILRRVCLLQPGGGVKNPVGRWAGINPRVQNTYTKVGICAAYWIKWVK